MRGTGGREGGREGGRGGEGRLLERRMKVRREKLCKNKQIFPFTLKITKIIYIYCAEEHKPASNFVTDK